MTDLEELEVYRNAIKSLEDLLKTQCADGNWNYDSYMHGMANGMILARSLFKEDAPDYLDAPDSWGEDEPDLDKPVAVEC